MNPRRRRIAIALGLVLLLALVLAPAALASAGGGSAGFGGGGGEGGGGGGGGGKGFALYLLFRFLIQIALIGHGKGAIVLVALLLIYLFVAKGIPAMRNAAAAKASQGRAAGRRTSKRTRRVELAAAEAAEEDPAFAPDVVKPAARQLFLDIQEAWDRRDRAALGRMLAPGLLREWERRLDDFDRRGWHNRVQTLEPPKVEYVGLRNTGTTGDDRVTVRIDARLRDYVVDSTGRHRKRLGRATETVRTREFWTLGKDAPSGRWILLSVEQGAEGAHALSDTLVATPWSDEQGMRDEALVEHAAADALPQDVKPAEVADLDFSGDARAAANDLSVTDGRFAPDILEVAARRAVAAWAEAVDGNTAALRQLADPPAVSAMVYRGDDTQRTRLVVRGAEIRQIRITRLDAAADPATMTIEVDLEGRRYLEDRNTGKVLDGSSTRSTRFTEAWTLALSGDQRQPWRIVRVAEPLASS